MSAKYTYMMFYALIPIAWTLIAVVCWAVCKVAQPEGSDPSPSALESTDGEARAGVGVRIWDDLPELSVSDARGAKLTTRGVR